MTELHFQRLIQSRNFELKKEVTITVEEVEIEIQRFNQVRDGANI